MFALFAVEEAAKPLSALLDQFAGLNGFAITATAGAGAQVRRVAVHRLEHFPRFGIARGRVIEINPAGAGLILIV
jgi:hypothetical protein